MTSSGGSFALVEPGLSILQLNTMLSGGGTDDQCVKLAWALRRLGQDVLLFGPDGRPYATMSRSLGVPLENSGAEGPIKIPYIFRAAKLIRARGIQILHAHHGRDIWPAILAAILSARTPKIVLTRHLAKSPRSWLSRRFVLHKCDALVAVSEFVAKVLKHGSYEPESPEPERRARPSLRGDHCKIQVIYGGIDTESFRPLNARSQREEWQAREEDYLFAVVGGYDLPRGKGQREFLQAAARIHRQLPQARFLLVGRGNMKEMLASEIARLGLTGKAWLTPYCNNMPMAMNAIDCLVHPQVGTEAFGLVICEAFACGKPVIASELDGIPEAFSATRFGTLVQPESVEALAAAMLEWGRKEKPSLEFRNSLHQKVKEQFSLEAFATRNLALYRALIDHGASIGKQGR